MGTTREKTPILYEPGEDFHIGGSRVVRQTDDDAVTLIGAGITLHEAVKAADTLAGAEGIAARVIDLYSLKPIDAENRSRGLVSDRGDRHRRGSLAGGRRRRRGARRAGRRAAKPRSGQARRALDARLVDTVAELLAAAGIDATHIADAARELAGRAGARGRSKAKVCCGWCEEMEEGHVMTGAEQDRQEDKAVDQDREADAVAQHAERSNVLHRLDAEQDQSPWIDFILTVT